MTDPKALARAIAARTKPRFIDTNPKLKTLEGRLALAREIAAGTPPRFIEIPRERGGGKIPLHGRAAQGHAWRTHGRAVSPEDDP
jgi:hypothetical protein